MAHRCCGNNMDGPWMLFRPAAEPQRWPTDAVSTTAATLAAIPASPETIFSHSSHTSPRPRLSKADPQDQIKLADQQ
jgi:hypothetical protein